MDDPGYQGLLGIEDHEAEEGRAAVALRAGDRHLNPGGVVHGGAIASMCDVAMGRAMKITMDAEERPVTIEMKVNYLEPGRPGLLVATAEVVKRGRLFTVVQVEVVQDEDGEALAEAMGTFTTVG